MCPRVEMTNKSHRAGRAALGRYRGFDLRDRDYIDPALESCRVA